MNEPPYTFEIFLRVGFDAPPVGGSANTFEILYRNNIRQYGFDSSFTALLPEIRNGDSSFIVFADEAINISAPALQSVNEFIDTNRNIAGLTLSCDALDTVYGVHNEKGILARLTQQLSTTRSVPSWFCVLNREYLKQSGLLECDYQTLEFFLCALSENFIKNSNSIFILDSVTLDFNSRLWIRDILLANSSGLASDYSRFNEKHIEMEIPSQFKINISGEYILLPSDNKYSEYHSNTPPAPAFSIICPAYKSDYFEEAVTSVVTQTCDDWEFVVVIDGPPAAEKEKLISILQKHSADSRVRFEVQDNRGTGPTRRCLAQMARGDFVITIDDDDMFAPDLLETFSRIIGRHRDASVFRGGAQLFGLVDLYLPPRQRSTVNGICGDLFEATQPFAIKRTVLENLGGFEGDKSFGEAGEDSDLFIKIDRARLKTCLIDRPMYFRRISALNQTLSFKPEECLEHIRSLINRHTPADWQFDDIHFQGDGPFIKAATSYRSRSNGRTITAATRFFDYQTLGESSHVLIDLEITSLCNSVCSFCPRDAVKRDNKFISMDLINILAEQICQAKGRRQVILCGIGESTLHPELETIVKSLHNSGAKVCMTTNGSLMNVNRFRLLADSGIAEINFSINAATGETHKQVMKMQNFDQIRENLSEIISYRKIHYPHIEVNVSFVLCNVNHHEVFDFVEDWRNKGISRIWIHPVNSRGGLVREDIRNVDMSSVEKRFKGDDLVIVDVFQHVPAQGNVCKIAQSLDFISVDGDMLLCALDYRCSSVIGNIKDTTIQQMHLNKFLRYKRREINGICHDCYFLPEVTV